MQLCDIGDAGVAVLLHRDHLPGGLDIDPSGLGDGPLVATAIEELGAELLLEVEKLEIQRRLRDEELVSCAGDILFLRDADDVFDTT